MSDARSWAPMFAEFHVAERGADGHEWDAQHDLLVTAARHGILGRLVLLRGDVDKIIVAQSDCFGNVLEYPFDVVSLDYSGGLLYRDRAGNIPRLRAIDRLIREQAAHGPPWLLFLSACLDNPLNGEVTKTLENIRTELRRYGLEADKVVDCLLTHEREEARYKVYVPYYVGHVAAGCRYRCQTAAVVAYAGNNDVPMMNFQFVLRKDSRTEAPRFPQERLAQLVNAPLTLIEQGRLSRTTLDIPKLASPPDPV